MSYCLEIGGVLLKSALQPCRLVIRNWKIVREKSSEAGGGIPFNAFPLLFHHNSHGKISFF